MLNAFSNSFFSSDSSELSAMTSINAFSEQGGTKELLSILTEKQRELYLAMTREGLTLREFARRKGIGIRAAFDLKAAVQKKFQKIF